MSAERDESEDEAVEVMRLLKEKLPQNIRADVEVARLDIWAAINDSPNPTAGHLALFIVLGEMILGLESGEIESNVKEILGDMDA
jgi:hypothetical protein